MKNVIELFNNYQDDTAIFVLSIAAIIYLLSKAGKRTSDHVYIAIMAAVVLLFNDIMYIAVKMVWSDSAYYALICAFPATIVCAAAPVKDTIKVADADGYAVNTPDRKTLWQIQTPQVFSANVIKEAYRRLYEENCFDGVTDDAMVVERYGDSKVKLVNCGYRNIKITTPEDMEIAGIFLKG